MTADALQASEFFQPRFDSAGLLAAIIVDATNGTVLMLGHMNAAALDATLATRTVHFYSRSRGELWLKGETSGNRFAVADIHVDCDQDALLIAVAVEGPGAACHTGRRSCFYRRLADDGQLQTP